MEEFPAKIFHDILFSYRLQPTVFLFALTHVHLSLVETPADCYWWPRVPDG